MGRSGTTGVLVTLVSSPSHDEGRAYRLVEFLYGTTGSAGEVPGYNSGRDHDPYSGQDSSGLCYEQHDWRHPQYQTSPLMSDTQWTKLKELYNDIRPKLFPVQPKSLYWTLEEMGESGRSTINCIVLIL